MSRELLNQAKDLCMWCLERNIHITAQHLPGVMNHIADAESRTMRDRLDWKLNPVIFRKIDQTLGPLEVDLFASRLNSVPSLFQLASGSLRSSYRCLPAGLVAIEGLCQPPMVPNRESTSPGANPTSTDSPPGTSLEDSAMVPTPTVDGSGMPLPIQGGHGDHAQPGQSTNDTNSTSRMEYLRKRYELSEEATTLMLKSRREKTNKSYNSLFGMV